MLRFSCGKERQESPFTICSVQHDHDHMDNAILERFLILKGGGGIRSRKKKTGNKKGEKGVVNQKEININQVRRETSRISFLCHSSVQYRQTRVRRSKSGYMQEEKERR